MKAKLPEHAKNGYDVELTHTGQKRRYGDSFKEFTVKSDKPESEVEGYCIKRISACSLTYAEWNKGERDGSSSFGDHFRTHYKFRKTKDGEYFYQVIQPSTH